MAYSTRSDVESRLSALPTEGMEAELDKRISDGIEYADSVVDGKLAARYKVPFTTVPKLIKNISADLAAAFAVTGNFSAGGEDDEPALAKALREWAMSLLCDIADGELLLNPDEAPPPDTAEIGVVPSHSRLGQRPVMESFDLYNEPSL